MFKRILVPVDGSYTLNLKEMTEVVKQLRTALVIPMHYFAGSSLQRFIATLREDIDPRTVTRLLFGTINSIVEWYKPGGSLSPEKLADDVITMAFDGLHAKA